MLDKSTRLSVYSDLFFKEKCFGADVLKVIDLSYDTVKYVGGCYGAYHKPTKFVCLLLKLLQLAPEEEIALELMRQDDNKYLRCLAALYFRLTCQSQATIYKELEPLLRDYRRLVLREGNEYRVLHVDEFVE